MKRLDGAGAAGAPRRATEDRESDEPRLVRAAARHGHAGGACLGLLVSLYTIYYGLYTQQFRSLRFVIVLASPIESVQTLLHSVSFLDEQGGQQS